MTTSIFIPQGTIVGRLHQNGVNWLSITLQADAYVEATREADGSWEYRIGKYTYFCAGGLATLLK